MSRARALQVLQLVPRECMLEVHLPTVLVGAFEHLYSARDGVLEGGYAHVAHEGGDQGGEEGRQVVGQCLDDASHHHYGGCMVSLRLAGAFSRTSTSSLTFPGQ